jgi:hypothetical protein
VTPSIGSLLRFSWAKTKELLFPFNFKRWLKILFIVWLSGQAAGFGGNNFNFPARRPAVQPAQQEETQAIQKSPVQTSQVGLSEGAEFQGIPASDRFFDSAENQTVESAQENQQPPLSPAVIILIVLIAIPVALLFAWLSARFNFILLDLLVNRDVRIGESFRVHKMLGNSYFLWSLAFGLIAIGIFLVLTLIFAFAVAFAKVLLWLLIPVFILLVLALAVIGVSIIDFVVPTMYRDKIKTMAACKKLISFKPNWKEIGIYILLKIALGIAAGIIALIVAVAVALVVGIAALVIGIPGGLLAGALPFLKPILIGAGVLLLIAGVLALLVLIGLATLPIPIFFRAFALSYLFRLFPDYNLLGVSPSNSPLNP